MSAEIQTDITDNLKDDIAAVKELEQLATLLLKHPIHAKAQCPNCGYIVELQMGVVDGDAP